jgi:hypothetical protein
MTKPPLADVPIRSAADLTNRWARLLEPPIFGARSLWLAWIGNDGLMLPVVVPIDDLPELSDYRLLVGLRELHGAITESHLDGKAHLAMALCRPGSPEETNMDYEWAHDFRGLFEEVHTGSTWSLHLAAGGRVSEIAAAPPQIWRQ